MCFFCVTLLRVTRTLWKYFPMVTPPPHWKIRQIDPPSPLDNPIPSVGGYGYFLEPHIMEILTALCISETSKFGHLVLYLLSTCNCCIDADGKMCS